MSIMQMFQNAFAGGAQATQQTQQQTGAGQPGNIPPNAGATDPNNSTNPAGTQQQTQQQTQQETPLANFADLWQPVNKEGGNEQQGFLGTLDPNKVMQAAKGTDFTKVITKDQLAKINAGGPEAMQTMLEAMNAIAQTAYAQAAIASSRMVETGLTRAQDRFSNLIPEQVKKLSASEQLQSKNPIFSNPAVSPILEAVQNQLAQKHPTASSAEIARMAEQYVTDFGNAVIPKQETQQQAQGQQEQDWSKFF